MVGKALVQLGVPTNNFEARLVIKELKLWNRSPDRPQLQMKADWQLFASRRETRCT